MISVDEALDRIQRSIQPLAAQTVPLSQACGRILAADVHAKLSNPGFDVSAMDGYAVRSVDTHPGAALLSIGTAQAGAGFAGEIGPGQCARIFTGAPVPAGADAVVMQEETSADGNTITLQSMVETGRNIRVQGEDFLRDAMLARSGDTLTPNRLTLLAAGNNESVIVSRRPSVSLLATGDELVPPGSHVGPDQIIASNSVGLAALFSGLGTHVTDCGIAVDERVSLDAALDAALSDEPDILLTTGGASVGEHDLVQASLIANGVDIDFWRIAMRPGKPLMFGRRGKTLVFGLPGNPVSAMVTARIFVFPALYKLMRAAAPAPLYLPLAEPLGPNGPRRHYLRAHYRNDPATGSSVVPIPQTDSAHLSSLASADVLIVQNEHCPGKQPGEFVQVHPL